MKCKILGHSYRRELERNVETYLSEGWVLQGGISIAVMNNVYAQAVIKH